MTRFLVIAGITLLGFASCQPKAEDKAASDQPAPMPQHQSHSAPTNSASTAAFTPEMVVNKKDFICEMPVTAGISDTCHVDGKAYGFCSHECMLEFKADPSKYLSAK